MHEGSTEELYGLGRKLTDHYGENIQLKVDYDDAEIKDKIMSILSLTVFGRMIWYLPHCSHA